MGPFGFYDSLNVAWASIRGWTGGRVPLMFGGEGDTISNVPLTTWSKFIFYLVENCHSHVLLTIFKHFKHQNDNFSTKLYTIFVSSCFRRVFREMCHFHTPYSYNVIAKSAVNYFACFLGKKRINSVPLGGRIWTPSVQICPPLPFIEKWCLTTKSGIV